MSYHYITVSVVMRDCASPETAIKQLELLLPQHPDETTKFMESWTIKKLRVAAPAQDESPQP